MDSKLKGRVTCVDYDPNWQVEFVKVKHALFGLLKDTVIAIEHVGSTSVVGCAAKPILDIDLVIENHSDFDSVKRILESVGFAHRGDQGIQGREVFKRLFEDEFMAYHLYCCQKDSLELLRHLSLKAYLTDHPKVRDAYGELKKNLAEQFPEEILDYMEGKDEFVKQMLMDLESKGYLLTEYRSSTSQ
ncbi:MAG: hypothetical protein CVU94_07455 [Firmicutes bacterium HGW-Firmicutes-19]|jgi:GrpB-like predicted nucleotidyltransferase (UPF0157 family)|nr:MAG: hypothetical protein CVU94_07455 [Firmicutes bacterium HGW-Firmicutes-19]